MINLFESLMIKIKLSFDYKKITIRLIKENKFFLKKINKNISVL